MFGTETIYGLMIKKDIVKQCIKNSEDLIIALIVLLPFLSYVCKGRHPKAIDDIAQCNYYTRLSHRD